MGGGRAERRKSRERERQSGKEALGVRGKRIRWTVGRRSKLGDKILGLERER